MPFNISKQKQKEKKIAIERIHELFKLANEIYKEDPTLSNRYVEIARKIGMKVKVRIPSIYKRQYCHKCYSFLVPGSNSRVRITGKTITYYCENCKSFNRIGYKNKAEDRKIQLECIVFRENDNKIEFLLLKRIQKKGGFWQPISGGFEKTDKSLLDAALRELKEETNISKEDIIKIYENVHYFEFTKHYLTNKKIPKIKEYVYGFKIKNDVKIDINQNISKEHEEIKWVSFKEALELLKWKDNKDALEKLNKIIIKNNK
jgi:ribonuclease P protein subunit RPR2